jgi:hypothetical protein
MFREKKAPVRGLLARTPSQPCPLWRGFLWLSPLCNPGIRFLYRNRNRRDRSNAFCAGSGIICRFVTVMKSGFAETICPIPLFMRA